MSNQAKSKLNDYRQQKTQKQKENPSITRSRLHFFLAGVKFERGGIKLGLNNKIVFLFF